MPTVTAAFSTLTAEEHQGRAAAHHSAVEDFLFTYYSFKPGQLARWHPGAGTVLQGAGEQSRWRFYTTIDDGTPAGGATVDVGLFRRERASMLAYVSCPTCAAGMLRAA